MKENNEEQAWAAGFFDGEGYIAARSTGKRYQRQDGSLGKQYFSLRMTVVQTGDYAVEMLTRFKDAVGHGAVHGPFNVKKHTNWSKRYEWRCCGYEKCISVCETLKPWLTNRKLDQINSAMEQLKLNGT